MNSREDAQLIRQPAPVQQTATRTHLPAGESTPTIAITAGESALEPSASLAPIEQRFPPRPLQSLVECLVRDSETYQFDEEHGAFVNPVWSKDMMNASMTCRYLREGVWAERLRRLVIRPDSDLRKWDEVLRHEHRHYIKEISLSPPCPARKPNAKQPPPAKSLGKAFAARANAFLVMCSGLQTLRDCNKVREAALNGPSLKHPTVRSLILTVPFLICQGKPCMAEAFPGLQELGIWEEGIVLFGPVDRIEGSNNVDGVRYLKSTIGGNLTGVRELSFRLRLPNEKYHGQWFVVKSSLFMLIVSLCPNVKVITLHLDPLYTEDNLHACLMPLILVSIMAALTPKSCVQEINVQSGRFNFHRMFAAVWTHRHSGLMGFERFLPHGVVLTTSNFSPKYNPFFRRFHFRHEDVVAGKVTVLRDFRVEIDWKRLSYGEAERPIAVILKDEADYEAIQNLTFEWLKTMDRRTMERVAPGYVKRLAKRSGKETSLSQRDIGEFGALTTLLLLTHDSKEKHPHCLSVKKKRKKQAGGRGKEFPHRRWSVLYFVKPDMGDAIHGDGELLLGSPGSDSGYGSASARSPDVNQGIRDGTATSGSLGSLPSPEDRDRFIAEWSETPAYRDDEE